MFAHVLILTIRNFSFQRYKNDFDWSRALKVFFTIQLLSSFHLKTWSCHEVSSSLVPMVSCMLQAANEHACFTCNYINTHAFTSNTRPVLILVDQNDKFILLESEIILQVKRFYKRGCVLVPFMVTAIKFRQNIQQVSLRIEVFALDYLNWLIFVFSTGL